MYELRRIILKGVVSSWTIAVAVAAGLLKPRAVLAAGWNKAAFESKDLEGVMGYIGASDAVDSSDISIRSPDIAENGAVVPVEITSRIADTDSISIIVEKNSLPLVASFNLMNGAQGYVSTRVKIGSTSNVRTVVKAGDKVYTVAKEVKVTIGGDSGDGNKEQRPPAFPWPPPQASAETRISDNWLPARGVANLADVAVKLESALRSARYPRWSYSSVPYGFALVCQMEQIKADGTPSPEPARWSTDMPSVAIMDLIGFIKALAYAQAGYYRTIVFIVTNQPWSRTGEKLTGKEAEKVLDEGFTWLPESIGKKTYGSDFKTTALVYEFKKVSRFAEAEHVKDDLILADIHLEKAGITAQLSR